MEYERLRAELAIHYGWTFSTIDDMTFDQIASAWQCGKQSKGIPVQTDEEAMSVSRNWRRHLGG